jgi:hypothetical protein
MAMALPNFSLIENELQAGHTREMHRASACGKYRHLGLDAVFNLITMMKSLVFRVALALFGTLIAAPQKSNAAEVVHGARGTVVHTNYNWNDPYWHSHKYGYWNGKRGYWHVVNGNHVFVVVN